MNGSPLQVLVNAYSLVVFVRVIISWIQLPPDNPVVQYSRALTDPVLEPIRKLLPASGGLDCPRWMDDYSSTQPLPRLSLLAAFNAATL